MIATSIIVLVLIWMLKEPSAKVEKTDSVTMKQIIWTVKEELERNPMLFNWMICLRLLVHSCVCFIFTIKISYQI